MKLSFSLLTATLFINTIHATYYGVPRTDSFDDLGMTLGIGSVPDLRSDGGIVYNPTFGYVSAGGRLGAPSSGIKPVSPKNVAILIQPAQGSLATTAACVVLKELYYACTTANVQASLNVPTQCYLTVEAYGNSNQLRGTQKFTFVPTGRVLSDMNQKTIALPAAKLIKITASIIPPDSDVENVGPLSTAALFDNITYVQYDDLAHCGAGF